MIFERELSLISRPPRREYLEGRGWGRQLVDRWYEQSVTLIRNLVATSSGSLDRIRFLKAVSVAG